MRLRPCICLALTLVLLWQPSVAVGSEADELKEAAKKAKELYEFGKDPSAEKVLDTAVTVMTMANPAVGAAFGAMKGLADMLGWFDKPDMVAEAIKQLDSRMQVVEARLTRLDDQLRLVQQEQFKKDNLARSRVLWSKKDTLKGLVNRLRHRPTEYREKRALAFEGMILADAFLTSRDADLWLWSDLDNATGTVLPPEFKPLPTFEVYVSALVYWMAAAEAVADRPWVKQEFAASLQQHIAFLTVRDGWDELESLGSIEDISRDLPEEERQKALAKLPASLPEHVLSRVSCRAESAWTYPLDGSDLCGISMVCRDRLARRPDMYFGTTEFVGTRGSLCTFSPPSQKTGEEESIERFYGTGLMSQLATTLGRLAATGTVTELSYGRLDALVRSRQILYTLTADGRLMWREHELTEDRRPPEEPASGIQEQRKSPAQPSSVGSMTRAGTPSDSSSGAASGSHLGVPSTPLSAQATARIQAPPKITHSLGAPSEVKSGLEQARGAYPAGGAGMYLLGGDGTLQWYRHDGWQEGTLGLAGPVPVDTGWDRYARIFAGSDGVLYGIDPQGELFWHRQNDYEAAQSPPSWQPSRKVGSGWGDFIHVFASGRGVIYAVQPGGALFRYTHTGYLTGEATWAADALGSQYQEVGAGWDVFEHVFSPGAGNVYGLRPDGALFWYRDTGYETGTASWLGPVELTSGVVDVKQIFARMWQTPAPPVLR